MSSNGLVSGGSPLIELLQEELRRQRVFLSRDEAEALARLASYENEDDLAYERVRHRRAALYAALRDRFIRDGRPIARWRQYVAEAEAAAGEPTLISELATQVLEWATRSSDRGAMFGGFAARLLRWIAYLLILLGLYSFFNGARAGGGAVAAAGLVLWLAARIVDGLAAERAATLTRRLLGTGAGAGSGTEAPETGTRETGSSP